MEEGEVPYVYRPPVQSPINPPYKEACQLNNGKNTRQHDISTISTENTVTPTENTVTSAENNVTSAENTVLSPDNIVISVESTDNSVEKTDKVPSDCTDKILSEADTSDVRTSIEGDVQVDRTAVNLENLSVK